MNLNNHNIFEELNPFLEFNPNDDYFVCNTELNNGELLIHLSPYLNGVPIQLSGKYITTFTQIAENYNAEVLSLSCFRKEDGKAYIYITYFLLDFD